MKRLFTLLPKQIAQTLSLMVALFFVSTQAFSADITSNAAGPWETPGTWVGGVVPTSSDNVTLLHAVSMAGNTPISATVSNVALTSNVATITTSAAHGLVVGQTVIISAVSVSGSVFNGTYTITTVPNTSSFTYGKTNANITSTAATGNVNANKFSFGGTITINGGSLAVNSGVTLTLNDGATINKLVNGNITGSIIYGTSAAGIINVNIGSASGGGTITTSGEISTTSVAIIRLKVFSGFTYDLLTTNNKQIGDMTVDGTLQSTSGSGPIILKGGLTVGSAGVITTRVSFRFSGAGYGTIISIPAANTNVKDIEFRSTASYTLANNTTINGTLSFPAGTFAGKLNLGAFNFTAPIVTGGSATSSWAATTGAGKLIINNLSTSIPTTFPIGASTGSYDPFTIQPTNSSINVSANVSATLTAGVLAPTKASARQWDITPSGATGACALTFTPSVLPSAGTYTTNPVLGHYNGANWEEYLASSYSSSIWSQTAYNGSFSPFAVGGLGAFNAVLPVELTTLTALNKGNNNLITWTTASEKDNASFIVERSANGQDFAPIGTLKGHGTSAVQQSYSFVDDAPLSMSYYRIKNVDLTGAESVSKVVSVAKGKAAGFKLYPSVVNDVLTVDMDAIDKATMTVRDITGRSMMTQQVTGQTQINVSTLPKGLYLLSIEAAGFKAIEKFVKQ